jgi:hypothetical protein
MDKTKTKRVPWNKGLTKETDERLRKAGEVQRETHRKNGKRVPWNKGKNGSQVAWNKGLTKETDDRVAKMADGKCGEGNGRFGVTLSEEERKIKSDANKLAIEEGRFTPHPYNLNNRLKNQWNGKSYRSRWELRFHKLNPDLLYENTRIRYTDVDGSERIYITDFSDHENKIIYEIKPTCFIDDVTVTIKEAAAIKWCHENGYTFKIVTEIDEPRMLED